jgi:hypothetical protein
VPHSIHAKTASVASGASVELEFRVPVLSRWPRFFVSHNVAFAAGSGWRTPLLHRGDVLSNDLTRIRGTISGLSLALELLLAMTAASDPTETRTPSESRGSNGVLGAELVTMTCERRFCVNGSSEVRVEEANQEMNTNTRELNMDLDVLGRSKTLVVITTGPSIDSTSRTVICDGGDGGTGSGLGGSLRIRGA